MVDPFPMARGRFLAALIALTFVLGVAGGAVADAGAVTGVVFFVGWFVAVPAVYLLGDSLSFVRESEGPSVWRATGREFAKGRNLADDVEPRDPVERLRDRYVDGEIDEAEFERRLEGLLADDGSERGEARDRRTVERERELP